MIKLAELLTVIEKFSKDAHWDYRLVKQAKNSQELIAGAEDYDIKDEELFNQFESFMNAYKELVSTLSISPGNFRPESLEDAAELIDTLKKRYDRIINNPYLNAGEEEGYEEEFDPGSFTKFLSDVAQDAEDKLKAAAGEDVDISEMRAAQYAKEFNQIQEEQTGTKQDAWSARRIQQALDARKRWFEDLMNRKKLNINDPRYQNYIEGRKRIYQYIVSDPERKTAYREKSRQRQAKFSKKLELRKNELLQLISRTEDPKKINEYQTELQDIEARLVKRKEKGKDVAKKIREKKESGKLDGLIVHLGQKLASFKKDAKVVLKNMAKKDPFFVPYKDAVRNAKQNLDNDNSPNNQAALETAIKREDEALQNYLLNHATTLKIVEDLKVIYNYRDQLIELAKTGWVNQDFIPEEAKPHLQPFIEAGEQLINNYARTYRPPMNAVRDILDLLKAKL